MFQRSCFFSVSFKCADSFRHRHKNKSNEWRGGGISDITTKSTIFLPTFRWISRYYRGTRFGVLRAGVG